ncbi:hypothetical protein PILCRDRAFT_823745 [Piloderma croceum F 1598]|uniref:Uncharacterized protein n=1 Tax=Piloderma croceum (strain F 1598) TaxID=765440 RepID=A0A0C3FHV7_PILCF|nr:hypothetical protein PILCRDRAFT_823745 [Piloderma croceum F 1598]
MKAVTKRLIPAIFICPAYYLLKAFNGKSWKVSTHWSSNNTEMLFNKTSANEPDIWAISTDAGLLERCASFSSACTRYYSAKITPYSFWHSMAAFMGQ